MVSWLYRYLSTNKIRIFIFYQLGLRKDTIWNLPFSSIPDSRLERDSGNWNLEEEEVQRRRNIFWECYAWDCWTVSATMATMFKWLLRGHWGYCSALYMGALQRWILRTRIVDFHETLNLTCCRLEVRSLAVSTPFLELIGFRPNFFFFVHLVHSWKFHYIAACLSVSIRRTQSVRRASYSSFQELDKRIRSFPIPSYLHSPVYGTERRDWDATPSRALQQYFAPCSVESSELFTLL